MGNARLKVLNPGLLSSVQDLGRPGFESSGFRISGAMDEFALRIGNRLVANVESEAGIEITFLGGEFLALENCTISITGADLNLKINERPVDMWKTINVKKNSIISLLENKKGVRAYLCVRGGVQVPSFMGSKSTDLKTGFGGFKGRALKVGDIIEGKNVPELVEWCYTFPKQIIEKHYNWSDSALAVNVIPGTEEDHFTQNGYHTFFNESYSLTSMCDRQGYQLSGTKIEHSAKGPNIVTNYTPLGAIQVPGSGQPIILLRDKQTTGGYAKIATVITPDISNLAQARPDDRLVFKSVSIKQAYKKYKEFEKKISKTELMSVNN